MPTFCARWPDGTFSIVGADDETDALIQLDELGDEPAALWPMDSCLLDFDLTDEGTFRLKQFGEQTGPEILERGYPVLSKTLESEAFAEHVIEGGADPQKYGSAATEILRKAVEAERDRLKSFQRTSATTERGKELQRELGGSGAYVEQAKLSNIETSTAALAHLTTFHERPRHTSSNRLGTASLIARDMGCYQQLWRGNEVDPGQLG